MRGGFTGEFGGNTNSNNRQPFINPESGEYKSVSDICGDHSAGIETHYHVFLSIIIFDNQRSVPEGIGDGTIQAGEVSDDCMRLIHTHARDPDKIHIELPPGYNGVITLGDFFNIWSMSSGTNILLSATSLLDQTGSEVILESNTVVVSIGNPANYELQPLTDVNEFVTLTLN